MLCQFEKLLYPPTTFADLTNSYMIGLYRPCETVTDIDGQIVTQIKAVGYCLPVCAKLRYDLHGHWSKSAKHGMQYEVESYDESITLTKAGIISYLSSGQIKGIGPALAAKIYEKYGDQSLEVLDKEPECLLEIPGISEAKLEKICESYWANRGARDVVAFLGPYGISPKKAVKFYREYGLHAIEVVKENPYKLCELSGIGFITADKIAASVGIDKLSVNRTDAGLIYVLKEAEGMGHMCMEKHRFIKECLKLLDTPLLTETMVANRATRLVMNGTLACYGDHVFRTSMDASEEHLAKMVSEYCSHAPECDTDDFDEELDLLECRLHIKFAPEQRQAVKMALSHRVCIITGGPGTGKTMIERAILDIYQKRFPYKSVVCCAPTGRAARRMEQATKCPASTIHRALGIKSQDEEDWQEGQKFGADLVLVDEVSMLDTRLAEKVFDALDTDARLVLIGDADQLPSVGPGAVLSELVACSKIPVVRLDKVFRQSAGSRIAVNAKLIRHGNLSLEYGDDFIFYDSYDLSESAETLMRIYLEEVAKFGVDNVALLSPFRHKTETGVNALNQKIRDIINPPSSRPEVTKGNKTFRVGDKVMQTENSGDVSNGDIGYIRAIEKGQGETVTYIDFGDGRLKEYDSEDLTKIELGYATTIHKSQGSEYDSVIINLQCAHSIMLTRPLIYTAVTRGKKRVIIVGERRAVCIAINKADTEKRGTCLAQRILKKV